MGPPATNWREEFRLLPVALREFSSIVCCDEITPDSGWVELASIYAGMPRQGKEVS